MTVIPFNSPYAGSPGAAAAKMLVLSLVGSCVFLSLLVYVAVHPAQPALALAWSPEGHLLAVGGGWSYAATGFEFRRADDAVRVWDIRRPAHPQAILRVDGPPHSVAWHPNGRELAIGHGEWGLHLWDVEHPGRVPIELQSGDLPTASQVLWNRAGTRLAIVDRLLNTSGLLIWDVSHSQQELASTPNTDDVIGHLEFLADDQSLLAVAGRSGVVSRWGPDASGSGPYTERVLTTLPSVGAAAYDLMGNVVNAPLARSADGRWLAGGGLEGRIRLWAWTPQGPPAQVGEPRLLPSAGAPLAQLAWSPDGRALAATEVLRADADRCDQTGRVFRWDVAAGTTPRVVWAGTPPANAVAWNPEGTLLAVAVCDGTVHVWDDQQGRVVHVLRP